MKPDAITMKDVAKHAGVAIGTVSKVINGQPVSKDYRSKVEKAIKELDYRTNIYARGLRVSKTNAIALIIPNILNPFFASFAHYVELALYNNGYKLTLCCANGETKKELECLNLVQMNRVDGIIALTYGDIEKDIPTDLPLVTFDRQFTSVFPPRVASDNFSGGILAAEKLFELGCTSPAFIRIRSIYMGDADRRKEGFLFACQKHHITPVIVDMTDEHTHEEAVAKLIKDNRDPQGGYRFDGLFCNTDLLAFTAKQMLSEDGCRIPDDVQIIGFDGIHFFNSEEAPLYVSSIVQPVALLAEKCVELVLEKDQSSVPSLTLLPVKFLEGGTTKIL